MRIGLGFAVVAMCSVAQAQMGSMGQQEQTMGSNQSVMAVMLEPATGLPYQATKITKSVQKLADGTVITQETKGLFARDTDGRVREDLNLVHSGRMDGQQRDVVLQSATVGDPVTHTMTFWSGDAKMAVQMALPNLNGLGKGGHHVNQVMLSAPPPPPPVPGQAATLMTARPRQGAADPENVRTEQLGQQSIEGVLATGVRTTTTIPLGKIGNDRPMTVVHEEWRSPELKILIKTVDTDPRTGEQTMELQNLVRTDPDKTLFAAPAGYTVTSMGDMMKMLGDLGKAK